MTQFINIYECEVTRLVPSVALQAVTGSQVTLVRGVMEPGGNVPPHRHPAEQVTVIVSGSMVVRVADQTRECGPGDVVVVPSDVEHESQSPDGAEYFEAFSPIRLELLPGSHGKPQQ